jgi:hypothetical protein
LGIGDWGLGIGDWAQSPIPNPQSPLEIIKLLLLLYLIHYSNMKYLLTNLFFEWSAINVI